MNPFTRHRYSLVRYIALYGLFAGVWAAAFGTAAHMPATHIVLDWMVFGVVSGFEGLILWSILKYGSEGIRTSALRAGFYLAVGAMFVAVAVGAECAALWTPGRSGMSGAFAATIPARSLCAALVYACFALWYSHAARADESEREAAEVSHVAGAATGVDAMPAPLERVTVRGGGGKIEVIGVGDIVCLQAEGDYVAIVTSSGRWLKEGTMKYFEEALPRGGFVRVHRSYIVAVAHIGRIESSGRERSVVMRGGGVIPVSETGYKLLRQALGL